MTLKKRWPDVLTSAPNVDRFPGTDRELWYVVASLSFYAARVSVDSTDGVRVVLD